MTFRRLICPARASVAVALLSGVATLLSSSAPFAEQMQVGTMYDNRVLVPTNQIVDPPGKRVLMPGRPVDIEMSPRGDLVVVLLTSSARLYTPAGEFLRAVAVNASGGGIAFEPGGERFWICELTTAGHRITGFTAAGALVKSIPLPAASGPADIAIEPRGRFAYVSLNLSNRLARVDLASGQVSTIAAGLAPSAVAVSPDGGRVFVANQAGLRPAPGETTAPSAGTRILVDSRGVARSGSLSVIDTASFRQVDEVETGLLPSGVAVSPDGALVAVANANSDSVSLFRADTMELDATLSLAADPGGAGSAPSALAFNPSGSRVYVTCSGNNSVAVLERPMRSVGPARRGRTAPYQRSGGFAADWYPMSVAVGPDETVYVANVKGIGTRNAASRFSVSAWMGTMNVMSRRSVDSTVGPVPADGNRPFRNAALPAGSPADLHSLGIEHVFLIVKENRTYDQVFGDISAGNGDPSLTMYGAAVTPNLHALANSFILLDNYYASGTVSADGHQWLMQSIVTPYLERAHGTYPRSYPFSGEDPLAFSPTGFLWTNAQEHGLTARVYGEFTQAANTYSGKWSDYLGDAAGARQLVTRSDSPIAPLNALVEHDYPAFALNVPDVFRARILLDRLRQYVADGWLPHLVIVQLPADHTVGVAAGSPTPNAMLADNDLAVGQIVEAISNTPFWPKSAIFITEDDAQDGVDHVDGHRTICLVVSPYTRRGAVDSTHYNHTSVVRTIEDLLGLPPMTKFDAAALPMRSVFTTAPDFSPYRALPNRAPLNQMTASLDRLAGPPRRAALASAAMNFRVPDAAPQEELNRILWQAARGWAAAPPRTRHHPECPPDKD